MDGLQWVRDWLDACVQRGMANSLMSRQGPRMSGVPQGLYWYCMGSGGSRAREMIVPLCSALVRLNLQCCFSSGHPARERCGAVGVSVEDAVKMFRGLEHLCYGDEAERTGVVQPRAAKVLGRP